MEKNQEKRKQKKDPISVMLNLIIIVLLFVSFKVGGTMLIYMQLDKESSTFSQDANSFSFDLKNNNYASLIQGKYMNEINGKMTSSTYHELADYVEALSLYNVYLEKGYEEKALQQKEIMEESRNNMGALTVYADEVDEMFHIGTLGGN